MHAISYLDRKTPPHISTMIIVAGVGAAVLNIFVASLTEMARDFGVSFATIQLAITGYLIATSVMQLLIGPLSDRFGRRIIMLACLVVFTFASIGAAMATNFTLFMILRIAQSVAIGGLVISRAVVRDLVARERAASLIGYVTAGMSLSPMFAPTIGGLLAEAWGWRANFYFLALIGAATLALVYYDQGETRQGGSMNLARQFGQYPGLLASRRFWGYMLVLAFASGAFFSYLAGAPFVGAMIYHLSGGELGLYFIFAPFGFMIGNWISGRFAVVIGIPRMIIIGLLVSMIGMAAVFLVSAMGMTHALGFFGFTTAIGFGNGMVIPSATAALLDIRPDIAGSATGLSGAMVTTIGAIIAQLTGLLLSVEAGITPLVMVIIATNAIGLVFALLTLARERKMRGGESS